METYYRHNTNCSLIQSKSTDSSALRLRVSFGGDRVDIRTRILIDPKYWDKSKQRVKACYRHQGRTHNDVNDVISSYVHYIDEYFRECERAMRVPILSELRSKFNYAFKQNASQRTNEFFMLFDQFIQEQAGVRGWGKSMTDVYNRLRSKIKKIAPDISLATLTTKNLEKIKMHLSATMYNDAVIKNLTYLRSFVRWAKKKHYQVCEDFDSYEPKLPKAHIVVKALSIEEVDRIYNLKLEEGSTLDQTRDLFIFQCYTALRYSDLEQLRPSNIYRQNNGKYVIRLLTEKDDDTVEYPLAQRALAIYKKYSGRIYDKGRLFPVLSNQKYNAHLKELGKKAGLTGYWIDYEYRLNQKIAVKTPRRDLCSHTARRTFIVNVLNEGISADLIMQVTSHSNRKAMDPYIKATMKGTSSVITALDRTCANV